MKSQKSDGRDLKTSSLPVSGGKARSFLPKIALTEMVYLVLENHGKIFKFLLIIKTKKKEGRNVRLYEL